MDMGEQSQSEDDQCNQPPKSGTDLFTTRRQDVFASLGELEKKHSVFLKTAAKSGMMEVEGLMKEDPEEQGQDISKRPLPSSRPSLAHTRDSDYQRAPRRSRNVDSSGTKSDRQIDSSNFKRPFPRNFPRGRRPPFPDFKKHPEKYTKYSLGDVSETDMSERSNSQAAFAFLEERRLQREKEERKNAGLSDEDEDKFDTGSAACSQGLITFSKPGQKKVINSSSGDDQADRDSKMAEATSRFHNSSLSGVSDSGDDAEEAESMDTLKMTEVNNSQTGDTTSTKETCSFKSRKKNKRNIRRKDGDDSD